MLRLFLQRVVLIALRTLLFHTPPYCNANLVIGNIASLVLELDIQRFQAFSRNVYLCLTLTPVLGKHLHVPFNYRSGPSNMQIAKMNLTDYASIVRLKLEQTFR